MNDNDAFVIPSFSGPKDLKGEWRVFLREKARRGQCKAVHRPEKAEWRNTGQWNGETDGGERSELDSSTFVISLL